MPEVLIPFADVAAALGFRSTRAVKVLCRRYDVPFVTLNKRSMALRESQYRLLLDRASSIQQAA